MRLEGIIEFLEEVAPCAQAMEYDNVGLLVGRRDKEVTRVLVSLDCTLPVVKEAKEKGCELVVCHHPVLFSGAKRITDETKEGEMLLFAMENNIAIFAAHTNLDFAEGGLNDYFLSKIGYSAVDTIEEREGRIFDADGICVKELCEKIKRAFDISVLRVAGDLNREVVKGAVCTGSGKSLAKQASEKADCYITGDMGYHDVLNLIDTECCYIEVSHYDSEKIVMELIADKLGGRFAQIEVFTSNENKNPLTII